ncbi:hypothetical protein WJX84_000913 [Apatococcus fuscideae]|uniref:DNA topoisomerase 6 subunit B n=1 Tax=Apatococcus fuscideae TaxID=2026836 RepID=A0AAW1SLK5_9CHLO
MPKKTDTLEQKSPAEFFAENKNIAGFDNPGKSLYTTVRELVENSLDAAESLGKLPSIEVTIEEVTQRQLNKIREVVNHERLDKELYQDHETEEAKRKRAAKELKERERLKKQLEKKGENADAIETKLKDAETKNAAAASKTVKTFYTVTVKDNGMGMPHKDIPDLLGRVLSGTKYGVKQTRGKFGLGAKMALIWSKMSTGLPIQIRSARVNQSFISSYTLDIDIQRNEPNVHQSKMVDNPDRWHGSELSVTILGNWQYYRAKIMKYLRQIAVITPYSHFVFTFKAEDSANDIHVVFARRTEKMPQPPKATKHHPRSVDLELVKQLIQKTKYSKLQQFLCKEFDAINSEHAGKLIEEMQSGAEPDTDLRSLTSKQILMLHQLLHVAKFSDPSGSHLSPAGEYNLRLGISKELHPDLVATYQGDAHVLEGHAFIVEAAVSIGGRDIKPGINIFRFANRIPLLFEGGSDVITKTALKRITWPAYKISPTSDKVGVFVSIVSTKIPYKGAGKEYIADDMQEMVHAVKQSIQQCCLQLKAKIVKQQAARDQHQRRKNLVKYIPNAARAVFTVLESMADSRALGPKRKRLQDEVDILAPVKQMRTDEDTLIARLTEHVEKIDSDMALEYQVQQGMAEGIRQNVFLMPLSAQQ